MNRRYLKNLVKPQIVAYNCGKITMTSAIPHGNARGFVLLITLVLLVILSVLGYTLTARIASQRHRCQYIIDYQIASYACQSGLKYAFAAFSDINTPVPVSRPNEPDFSDLFALDEKEYKKLLSDWAAQNTADAKKELAAKKNTLAKDMFRTIENIADLNNPPGPNNLSDSNNVPGLEQTLDINDIDALEDINNIGFPGDINDVNAVTDFNDPNMLTIRGPYGPSWPLVLEPLEFEIGSARVRIEIEDENAKYPLIWMLLDSNEPAASAGLELFCEWMSFDSKEIKSLETQLKEMGKIKKFTPGAAAVTVSENKAPEKTPPLRTRGRTRQTRKDSTQTVIPPSSQLADFAKLFHSSLIDADTLARPTIVSETRKESALKYTGTWASDKVNINTAPRNVLEAAFSFGGDQVEIADKIIQRRRRQPFKDIEDLRKELFRYAASIDKCKKYITASSDFFTVKITATSGAAKVSAVLAVTKAGKKTGRVAIIFG